MPIGVFSRASFAYSSMRRVSRWRNGASFGLCSSARSGDIAPTVSRPDAPVLLAGADPARRERRNIIRVRAQEQLRGLLHTRQQVGVPYQIGDTQLCESGLARPEQLSRAPQLQIATGDL